MSDPRQEGFRLWKELFQSLHSAMIDELNDRLPDEKPELGLPFRGARWTSPTASLAEAAVQVMSFPQTPIPGFAAIVLEAGARQTLNCGASQFLDAVVRRSEADRERRRLRLVAQKLEHLEDAGKLAAGLPPPDRVLWTPIGISGGRCFLAVAIRAAV